MTGRGLLTHKGHKVNSETGTVYGIKGAPVGRRHSNGYVYVAVFRDKDCFAHRFIWEAVNGPIPNGYEINHKNGIKHDNRIENLELVTHGENMQHACDMGLKLPQAGEAHWAARLTEAAVRFIRKSSESTKILAATFGVTEYAIRDARSGRSWKHVDAHGEGQ